MVGINKDQLKDNVQEPLIPRAPAPRTEGGRARPRGLAPTLAVPPRL